MKLHSDDFGYNRKNDAFLIKCLQAGTLHGVSVLATMVSSESLEQLKKVKNADLSIHLNLIEGNPQAHATKQTGLVNGAGELLSLPFFFFRLLTGGITKEAIAEELDTQIKHLKDQGVKLTILDSHQHTHALSPIAEITVALAKTHGIPVIRNYGNAKTVTIQAKIKYTILKIMAFLTNLKWNNAVGLPVTWKGKDQYMVMSWEGPSLALSDYKNLDITCVVHPNLGYDTNSTYMKLLTHT